MPLDKPDAAAREATAAVSTVQGSTERGRDCPGARADLNEVAVGVLSHHDAAGIAGEALGRFRGNARALFEDGLAGMVGVCEDGRVDMDDDLVTLTGSARVDSVMERSLGEEGKGVGLKLRHR